MHFRDITPAEEAEFRQWARDHYRKDDPVNPLWHPVVQDECGRINFDRFRCAIDIQDAGNMRVIAHEFVRVVDAAMADTGSATETWADPAVVFFVNKLESLSRSEANFSAAYECCQKRAVPPAAQSSSLVSQANPQP